MRSSSLRLVIASSAVSHRILSAFGETSHVRVGLSGEGNLLIGWSTEDIPTCERFQETGDCAADGKPIAGTPWPCNVTVPCEASSCPSGYCKCTNGEHAHPVDCKVGSHDPFLCTEECRRASTRVRYAAEGSELEDGLIVQAMRTTRWRGRWWNVAELPALADGIRIAYQCSSADGVAFDPALELRVPTRSTTSGTSEEKLPPTRLLVFGDFADSPDSGELVRQAVAGATFDAALHLGFGGGLPGDSNGDRLIDTIRPVASMVPYLALPGDGDDLGAYSSYFQLSASSRVADGKEPWYAFNMGRARVIMLWTEVLGPGDGDAAARRRQLAWLERELAHSASGEERQKRPWIVVAGHRPMYCTLQKPICSTEAAKLRSQLEPMFQQHKVDLYLSAHVHAYERTYPVQNRSLCPYQPRKLMRILRRPCATVYITNGDAGVPLLEYDDNSLPALWTAQRHTGSAGFGELTIHNATHLQYRQLDASGAASDEFWLRHVRPWEDEGEAGEENFLEAVGWLSFAIFVLLSTMSFIRWAHTDGLRRRDEALRELRVELSVLSGLPIKVGSGDEVRGLASESVGHGLH